MSHYAYSADLRCRRNMMIRHNINAMPSRRITCHHAASRVTTPHRASLRRITRNHAASCAYNQVRRLKHPHTSN
eukprot:770235-Pleurochrysis_carterae.AAC.5